MMRGDGHLTGCDSLWRLDSPVATDAFVPAESCPTCRAIEKVEGEGVFGWDDFAVVERMCAGPNWSRVPREGGPLP